MRRPGPFTYALTWFGGVLLGLVGVAAFLAYRGADRAPFIHVDCIPPSPLYDPTTPADDAAVAALTTDIFVGRVLARSGGSGHGTPVPGGPLNEWPVYYPETHLAVEVLQAVKGSAAGAVAIHKGQHYVPGCWAAELVPDPPLRPGDTGLFLAQPAINGDDYSLITPSHFGYYPIDDDQERAQLVARFAAAVAANDPGTPSVLATPSG